MQLINKYGDLGLTTPVVIMQQTGQTKKIIKHLQRAATLWDCRSRNGNFDDGLANRIINVEKETISKLLYKITKKILITEISKPGSNEEKKVIDESDLVPNVKEEQFMKSHEEMFEYCIEKLLKLRIITPYLRAYYSEFQDEEGITMGSKQIAEEDIDKGDEEQFEDEE
tara:strand:+ start:89 stop:595 length:507 start_codon:yes stop_codon:yes gene_type:complete